METKNFRVSPLLGALGHKNLSGNTVEKTHLYFGRNFFRKKPVSLLDAAQAIGHFHSAKAFETAAVVLVMSLNAFLREERAREDFGLTSVWVGVGVPEGVELKTRLFVRALQAAALQKLGKNSDEILAELDALLAGSGDKDQLGKFGACVTIAIHFSTAQPAVAARYAVKAVMNPSATKQLVRKAKGLATEVSSLVWACGAACRNADDVETWFAEVGKLSFEQRAAFFGRSMMSDRGCQTICDTLWTKESDKPEAERNWPRILKLLTRIEELGRKWNSEILWACAIRAKVVVHSDYLAELEVGARLVQAAQFEKYRSAAMRVSCCLSASGGSTGMQRTGRVRSNGSIKLWNPDSASFALLRQRALLELGIAEERINRGAAVKACDRAAALARSSKSLSDLRLIEALGEKAIACWNAGDRKAAFACWEEGAAKILDWPKRDDGWKSLVGMFGHASGYFSALFSRPWETCPGICGSRARLVPAR